MKILLQKTNTFVSKILTVQTFLTVTGFLATISYQKGLVDFGLIVHCTMYNVHSGNSDWHNLTLCVPFLSW